MNVSSGKKKSIDIVQTTMDQGDHEAGTVRPSDALWFRHGMKLVGYLRITAWESGPCTHLQNAVRACDL